MQSMKNAQNHYDLCREFKSGMYEASMTVYELKKQVPRIVAAEFFWLEDIVKLKVGKESSVFQIFTNKDAETKELWYLLDGDYIKAKRNYFVVVLCAFIRGNVLYLLCRALSKKGVRLSVFPKEMVKVLAMTFGFSILNCCFVIVLSLETGSSRSMILCISCPFFMDVCGNSGRCMIR